MNRASNIETEKRSTALAYFMSPMTPIPSPSNLPFSLQKAKERSLLYNIPVNVGRYRGGPLPIPSIPSS
jgi:hypothetical protein